MTDKGHVTKSRILLADDHPMVLEKVAELLGDTCQIIGSVPNGRFAVDTTIQQHPDVLLMDISMPVMNGIEAAKCLLQFQTETKIVFLTVHDDPDFVNAALDAGATGYVVKSRMATDLLPAIRQAIAGHRFISPCLHMKN
jgi:DNA-binding NarL/FixJ family response regulator